MSEVGTSKIARKTSYELEKLGITGAAEYLDRLSRIMYNTSAFVPYNGTVTSVSLGTGVWSAIKILEARTQSAGNRLMIVGNGGSAAMAIHMLADYVNVGGVRTMDFTSPALITCMANDYGYENVFAKPIEKFADEGDVLFAISSSGKSPNILGACDAAKIKGCAVVTFSGMSPDNPLSKKGEVNFYTPSDHYGFIELTHEALLHCILDLFVKRQCDAR